MDWVHAFLERVDAEHSRRAYRADLRDFLDTEDGQEDWSAEGTTRHDIGQYVRALRERGLAVSTQRRRLSTLRRFFDWLIEQNVLDHNPARACQVNLSSVGRSTGDAQTSSVLTTDEIQTLVRAAADAGDASTRDRALLITILYAALRRAEVAAMNVDHVRPLGRHWVIDVSSGDGWSSAYVKVPNTVVEAIDAVQDRYDITKGPIWRSLSNRNRGSRLTPDAIYKIVRRTGKRAGLRGVTVESLRQTGLTLARAGGATMNHLREHARVKTVRSIERYTASESGGGRLNETAVDFLDLDLWE